MASDQQKPADAIPPVAAQQSAEEIAAQERKRFIASQNAQRRAMFGLPPEE